MALESLPAHITSDGQRSSSDAIGQPDHPSVEDWFQQFGRDLAWKEQRANEPPAPAHEPELVGRAIATTTSTAVTTADSVCDPLPTFAVNEAAELGATFRTQGGGGCHPEAHEWPQVWR